MYVFVCVCIYVCVFVLQELRVVFRAFIIYCSLTYHSLFCDIILYCNFCYLPRLVTYTLPSHTIPYRIVIHHSPLLVVPHIIVSSRTISPFFQNATLHLLIELCLSTVAHHTLIPLPIPHLTAPHPPLIRSGHLPFSISSSRFWQIRHK